MKINPSLVGPCGLYCGVCAIYIAGRDNNLKLKEKFRAPDISQIKMQFLQR